MPDLGGQYVLGVVVELLAVIAVHVPPLSIRSFGRQAVGGSRRFRYPSFRRSPTGCDRTVVLVDVYIPADDFGGRGYHSMPNRPFKAVRS